jgi:hypothetical protein
MLMVLSVVRPPARKNAVGERQKTHWLSVLSPPDKGESGGRTLPNELHAE